MCVHTIHIEDSNGRSVSVDVGHQWEQYKTLPRGSSCEAEDLLDEAIALAERLCPLCQHELAGRALHLVGPGTSPYIMSVTPLVAHRVCNGCNRFGCECGEPANG